MNKLSDKFKTAEKLVAFCLKEFPETRGNDKALRLKVWNLEGFRLPHKLIPFFYKVLDAETISRVRRKIQSQGLFRADSLKTAQRSLRSMETREMFRKPGI